MVKRTLLCVALFAAIFAASGEAANARPALSLPLRGTFVDSVGGNGTFEGTFKLMEFGVANDGLVAKGYVVGTLTSSTGTVIGSVVKPASFPVEVSRGASVSRRVGVSSVQPMAVCPILHLDLGPLHLDLLGLVVDLSQVILDITAETGAGNLLGNLLCAILGLLDGVGGAGAAAEVADLLNRVLDALSVILG